MIWYKKNIFWFPGNEIPIRIVVCGYVDPTERNEMRRAEWNEWYLKM
jgi:hypothetical protein